MYHLKRLFTTSGVKGTRNYISSQKKYEIIRTLIYFGISASLYIAGIVATGDKMNYLTIVAVLGCLPASKSLVNTIMYLRYNSLKEESAEKIVAACNMENVLFDMVFTAYDKNYCVEHLCVVGNTVCGYSSHPKFVEQDFYKHIDFVFKKDNMKNISVKVFTDLDKYAERVKQMNELDAEDEKSKQIMEVLKSVAL